ncbi:hypothetical protein LJC61_02610 [Ruminococcaceae bacterium OttesenSCG-928-A16]|nr:hypothetical protein [Ruminococcaceae bacterium OttesenSCG-928-A16]
MLDKNTAQVGDYAIYNNSRGYNNFPAGTKVKIKYNDMGCTPFHVEADGEMNWVDEDELDPLPVTNPMPELKTGMVIQFANGSYSQVFMDTLKGNIFSGDECGFLCSFNADGKHFINPLGNIVKIFKPVHNQGYRQGLQDMEKTLIWEHEEPTPAKEMTEAEISAALGYKVKVVADE